MEIGAAYRALRLMSGVINGRPAPAILPMRVQKPAFYKENTGERLGRSTPEAEGVNPKVMDAFLRAAAEDRTENIHSITVLRHGRVIAERSFVPYDREIWHATHSLCKTITALAVGILLWEGRLRLDERIGDIFSHKAKISPQYRNLTVFHLLTMTSGVSFCEVQSVTEEDWLQGYLTFPPLFRVGERFHYNSMNSYVLSAVVCEKTGKTLSAFLDERLFLPMGIRNYHWETCPKDIEKGGWGLYLLQEDAAKIGQLLLQRGKWNGKQLVDEKFVRDMCCRHSDPPEEMGKYGYGYHCWMWNRRDAVQLSGLFGQTVLVVPDLDMVIAVNAGNGRMFGESDFLRGCEAFLNAVEKEERTLSLKTAGCETRPPRVPAEKSCAARYDGAWCFRHGRARLLPVFIQLLENNFTTGINTLMLTGEGDTLCIEVGEGKERNRFTVGFSSPQYCTVTANGEKYRTAIQGEWETEDTLKVDILFLEQASIRHMRLHMPENGTLQLVLWESPGKKAVEEGAVFLFRGYHLEKKLQKGVWKSRLERLMEPTLTGRPVAISENKK